MALKLNKSCYQVQELATRWARLYDETITNSFVLQYAIDGKFSLYAVNHGLRRVNLWVRAGLGRQSRKIVAYLNSEFIKLADFQIRELLCSKQMTIILLELSESDFIPGDESFDLSEIEAAILDENERIIITPDDISYLSVMVEDVIAFEQELGCLNNEHKHTKTKPTGEQEGVQQQAKTVENNGKRGAEIKGEKIFDKRLVALEKWLISLGYILEDKVIILPKHYTLKIVFAELGKYSEKSQECKGLFATFELNSFDSHFWGKQKLVELMRGNKSAIL